MANYRALTGGLVSLAALAALPVLAGARAAGAEGAQRVSVAAACELSRDQEKGSGGISSRQPGNTSRPLFQIGGLSGIAKLPGVSQWLAVSDDQDAPRWYRLAIEVGAAGVGAPGAPGALACRATVIETVTLSLPPQEIEARGQLQDVEGIAVRPDGRVLVSTEGDARPRPIVQAGLFEFEPSGAFVRRWPLPARYTPDPGPPPRGVRRNASFESLAATPDGQRVFMATEEPLYQDGSAPTFGRGGVSRLIEYAAGPQGFAVSREFALPLEPIPHPGDMRPTDANSGAVDLLALDASTLLLLERAFVAGRRREQHASFTEIVLSRLELDQADDVSKVESLEAPLVRPVRKDVLVRLRDLAAQLPEWLRDLDNFEGLAIGPTLPDGSASLVLVSDDNFNSRQRTAFIVLRMQ